MAIVTADVIAPVFTSAKVIVRLLSGVTGEAGFGRRFGVEMLWIDDLCLVAAAFDVCLSRPVAGLTSLHLIFPTLDLP